jgi:hypothetical protein
LNPGWARGFRAGDGVDALLAEAAALLEEFGLVERGGDEIIPRAAAARFTVRIVAASTTTAEVSEVGS